LDSTLGRHSAVVGIMLDTQPDHGHENAEHGTLDERKTIDDTVVLEKARQAEDGHGLDVPLGSSERVGDRLPFIMGFSFRALGR